LYYYVIHDSFLSNTEKNLEKKKVLDSVSGNCRIETPQYFSSCENVYSNEVSTRLRQLVKLWWKLQ